MTDPDSPLTTLRRVQITLIVVGVTDRDPWEWGEELARFLQNELHEYSENSAVVVECVDVEKVPG